MEVCGYFVMCLVGKEYKGGYYVDVIVCVSKVNKSS
jgi:hypothetical protein